MDDTDRNLITRMCEQFNLKVEEEDRDGVPTFVIDGTLELAAPSEDTDNQWTIYSVTVIHGRMYLSNGDPGYPDDVDVEEVQRYPSMFPALVDVVKLAVERGIENMGIDHDYATMIEEERQAAEAPLP